jgi:HD-GYP domain-containing protein (c-di-GMP phosphodiesterase class II)
VADALEEISAGAGSQFDPVLAKLFIEAIDGTTMDREFEASSFPVALQMV